MICQFCKAENAKSTVTPGMSSSTCMAFTRGQYDEDGKWIAGVDPNWHTTEYYCSRGHRFSVMQRQGDDDVVRLVSTTTMTGPESGSVVLAVDPSRCIPNASAVTTCAARRDGAP